MSGVNKKLPFDISRSESEKKHFYFFLKVELEKKHAKSTMSDESEHQTKKMFYF